MIKSKFKSLILMSTLFIFASPIEVYAVDSNNSEILNNNTIMNGEIGEWDPSIDDNPNFNDYEIEGDLPTGSEYYTISVTVPVSMEFTVLPNSHSEVGSFYSPIYNIKNNGTKTINVKVSEFERVDLIDEEDTVPLYVEKIQSGDNRTQMELNMCAIEDPIFGVVTKTIDLTELTELSDEEKTLYQLEMNELKRVKFNARYWELPEGETGKKNAASSFIAQFEFSIS